VGQHAIHTAYKGLIAIGSVINLDQLTGRLPSSLWSMSYAQAIPVCWICKKTSSLKVLETDQYGQAVHRECYFSIEALSSEGGLAMYVLPFRDTSVNPSEKRPGLPASYTRA